MKIIQVSHHFRPCLGGVEKVVEELNKQLAGAGHNTKVLCLNKCHNGKKLPAKQQFGKTEVERLPFLNLRYYKIAPFPVSKLKQFDLVHVHSLGFFSDYLALTKFLHRKPLVLSTHGAIFHTKNISMLKKIYFFGWCRLLLKAFNRVIAVSEQDRQLFSKIAGNEKIALIENGIDFKRLSKTKRSPEKNSFLYFGRLSKNKGLSELIDTFAIFCRKETDARLLIAGKDFEGILPKLKEQAKSLEIEKNVAFLGEVSDSKLQQRLSKTEFFVSASYYEGFGIAALEAMASGLIPILNKIDSFKGFAEQGKNGFIVDFSKSEQAAKQISKAASLDKAKKRQLSENAKRFASGFEWKGKAASYEKEYRRCIK